MRSICVTACLIVWSAYSPAGAATPTLAAGEIMRLRGHTDAVFCAAISDDAKLIATGSNDGTAIIWDAKSGAILQKLPGHARGVTAVGFSADGSRLVTGSLDQTARVWDTKSGELVAILQAGHFQHVHGAAISPDGKRVLTASCDHSVVLWDVDAEKQLQRYPQPGEAHAVAFSPDGKTFVIGCRGAAQQVKTLNLYDATTGQVLSGFELPAVDAVAYVGGGKRLIAMAWVSLYSLDVESQKISKMGDMLQMEMIAPTRDGRSVLVAMGNGAIFNPLQPWGRAVGTYPMGERVRAVAVSPDGKWGVVAGGGQGSAWAANDYKAGRDFEVKVLSLPVEPGVGEAFLRPTPPAQPVIDGRIVMSRDGSRLMTFFSNGGAIWWDAASGKERGRISHQRRQMAGVLSGDGSVAAISEDAGAISIYNSSGEKTTTLSESTLQPFTLAMSADGKRLFASGLRKAATQPSTQPATRPTLPVAGPSEVHVYDLSTGKIVSTFHGPVASIMKLELSPDGKSLLGLCGIPYGGEMAAVVWDIESSRQLWKWMPKTAPIGRPAITAPGWAADSRTVAFAYENTAIVIDAASGKVIAELTGHTSPIRQIAFDPDGKRLWSGADHDVVRNWDWAQGKQLGSVKASANYGVFRFEAGHHELIQLSGTSLLRHNLDQK